MGCKKSNANQSSVHADLLNGSKHGWQGNFNSSNKTDTIKLTAHTGKNIVGIVVMGVRNCQSYRPKHCKSCSRQRDGYVKTWKIAAASGSGSAIKQLVQPGGEEIFSGNENATSPKVIWLPFNWTGKINEWRGPATYAGQGNIAGAWCAGEVVRDDASGEAPASCQRVEVKSDNATIKDHLPLASYALN